MLERPNHADRLDRDLSDPDERRLDELIEYLRSADDPVATAVWFLEGLAGAFAIPVHPGARDPVKNWERLSQAAVWALHQAGQEHPELRSALARAARTHVVEILGQVGYWREDEQERSLLQRWGDPVTPTSPPTSQRTARG